MFWRSRGERRSPHTLLNNVLGERGGERRRPHALHRKRVEMTGSRREWERRNEERGGVAEWSEGERMRG